MEPTRACPQCQQPLPADAPAGLCPQCLMKAAAGPAPNASGAGAIGEMIDIADPAEVAKKLPQFEILEMLGRGGMGVVYKARQRNLDREVALKILPPLDAQSPDFVARFSREARALAKLNHPNIVNVHDFGETGGLYYIVMEYVDGANLRQILQTRRLAPAEALAIVPKICDALEYAHEEGLVHRDIKPENLLIDKKGRVKIADFGLAKLLCREPLDMTLTLSGVSLGTLRYMAPEQMDKPETVDHRADLYSLGVVIYEMLTGELPVGRFDLPSQKAAVDVRLDEIVLHALEKEPDRRYQHASEVRTDVEKVTSKPGAGANTPPSAPSRNAVAADGSTPKVPLPQRRPFDLRIAAALLVTLAAGLAFWKFGLPVLRSNHQAQVPGAPATKNAPSTPDVSGLWQNIRHTIQEKTYETSSMAGEGFGRDAFQDIPPGGALLTGFHFGMLKLLNTTTIESVQGIYQTADGEFTGLWHGPAPAADTAVEVKARPGYAVGAIIGHDGGNTLEGLTVVFMRIGPQGLNAQDIYSSPLIGSNRGREQYVSGDGTPVIGIAGKTQLRGMVSGLSLVFAGHANSKGATGTVALGTTAATPRPSSALPETSKTSALGVPEAGGIGFQIRQAIHDKTFEVSNLYAGGTLGYDLFQEIPAEGTLLTGLNVGLGKFSSIESVQGIYQIDGRETTGAWHGPPPATVTTIEVKARPGYVFGALIGHGGGLRIEGLIVIFMRIDSQSLDPQDAYASPPIGNQTGLARSLGGDGTPIIGLAGKMQGRGTLAGLGLIFARHVDPNVKPPILQPGNQLPVPATPEKENPPPPQATPSPQSASVECSPTHSPYEPK